MTAEQFTYWLQGFFELSGATTLNEEQVKVVKDHIALVMKKETPNSIGVLFDPKDPNINLAQYLSKPYVPLQVSNIFKKDETMTNCPECSTGILQETSFIEEGKTVKVIACNRCRYNRVEKEK